MTERDKANELVQGYAKHVGAMTTTLDKDDEWTTGEVGLRYEAYDKRLIGRIFIMKLRSYLLQPEAAAAAKTAMLELNSPKIITLFERDGGYFEFEDKKDMLFLKKNFPSETISSKEFNRRWMN